MHSLEKPGSVLQEKKRYFENLNVGEKFSSRWLSLSVEEMIKFASEFDPQYFHIDPDEAQKSPFGEIVASGTHTFAVWNKLNLEVNGNIAWIAGLGFNDFKFPNPLRAGISIQSTSHLLSKRDSDSDVNRGLVIHEYHVVDEDELSIFECTCPALVQKTP